MSALAATVAGTAVATVAGMAAAMAAAMAVATAVAMAVPAAAVPEAVAPEAVAPEVAVPEVVVPEAAPVVPEPVVPAVAEPEPVLGEVPEPVLAEPEVLALEVPVLAEPVPEAGLAEPEQVVRAPPEEPEQVVPVAQAAQVVGRAAVQVPAEPVELLAVARVQAEPVVELLLAEAPPVAQPQARAERQGVPQLVQEQQAWAAAQVGPLAPASAVEQRVSVSAGAAVVTAPSAALAPRVRSVPLPALRAWALQQAVAHPMAQRRMGLPRGRTARRQGPGVGRGATSWRPLLSRRSRAPTNCVPCTSSATSSKAPRTASRQRTARNCRSIFAADANCQLAESRRCALRRRLDQHRGAVRVRYPS